MANEVEHGTEAGSTQGVAGSDSGVLDNPIWNALTSDHARFAVGGTRARRYPEEIGPLSGMPEQSAEGYEELRAATSAGGLAALFFSETPRPGAGWTVVRGGELAQMAAPRPELTGVQLPEGVRLRRLTPEDAGEMVALAKLTEPGPFRLGTIALGSYFGIFEGERLVSMAGERLSLPGFVEVSAVCTHPEARGRGYAAMLMSRVIEGILAAGKRPFLHTWADNHGAIRIYERLGFRLRRTFELAVVQRG